MSLDRMGGNKSTGAGQLSVTFRDLLVDGTNLDPARFIDSLEEIEYYEYAHEVAREEDGE